MFPGKVRPETGPLAQHVGHGLGGVGVAQCGVAGGQQLAEPPWAPEAPHVVEPLAQTHGPEVHAVDVDQCEVVARLVARPEHVAGRVVLVHHTLEVHVGGEGCQGFGQCLIAAFGGVAHLIERVFVGTLHAHEVAVAQQMERSPLFHHGDGLGCFDAPSEQFERVFVGPPTLGLAQVPGVYEAVGAVGHMVALHVDERSVGCPHHLDDVAGTVNLVALVVEAAGYAGNEVVQRRVFRVDDDVHGRLGRGLAALKSRRARRGWP